MTADQIRDYEFPSMDAILREIAAHLAEHTATGTMLLELYTRTENRLVAEHELHKLEVAAYTEKCGREVELLAALKREAEAKARLWGEPSATSPEAPPSGG